MENSKKNKIKRMEVNGMTIDEPNRDETTETDIPDVDIPLYDIDAFLNGEKLAYLLNIIYKAINDRYNTLNSNKLDKIPTNDFDPAVIIKENNALKFDRRVGKCTTGITTTIDDNVYKSENGSEIFNDYSNNIASSRYSHAEGSHTIAGMYSHAEGMNTKALDMSHAEGRGTIASGMYSHAEGSGTIASGSYGSHAEGYMTEASGYYSHAEGHETKALEINSHAEGSGTEASGNCSHAEGGATKASSYGSHAEGSSTIASGSDSHAEGDRTEASGSDSHAEGFLTKASRNYSHAEGHNTIAKYCAHVEGENTVASGNYSHASGLQSQAIGNVSYAEGQNSLSLSSQSHAEGFCNVASGWNSHAEGDNCIAGLNDYVVDIISMDIQNNYFVVYCTPEVIDELSKNQNKTLYIKKGLLISEDPNDKYKFDIYTLKSFELADPDNVAVPEVSIEYKIYTNEQIKFYTTSDGNNVNYGYTHLIIAANSACSNHAEGTDTKSLNIGSHSEGKSTEASGVSSHAEGCSTLASGDYSHAEGYGAKASEYYSHAEGYMTRATKYSSHAEGSNTVASGEKSHAEGYRSTARGPNSHAEGSSTLASGENSHAEGYMTIASGNYSHSSGFSTTADQSFMTAIGSKNKPVGSGSSDLFAIGNGSTNDSNIFRVNGVNGCYSTKAFNSTGADYAEFFLWEDENALNEDRIGRFVTLNKDKIKLASSEDDYIVGIISGDPSVIGDVHDDQWHDMYLRDVFGRTITEYKEYSDEVIEETIIEPTTVEEEVPDPNDPTKMIKQYKIVEVEKVITHTIPGMKGEFMKVNPAYNPDEVYIPRSKRPEWGCVGMMGKIVMIDDGTCQPNGFCWAGENGIATHSDKVTKFRVMNRIDETHIKVVIVP